MVRKIAEHLGSPVVSSRSGKGVLPARHPLSLGMFEARFKPLKDRVDECDVILAVGTATDMSARLDGQTVIRIDDDPDVIGQDGAHTHGILGDAALSLEVLYGNLAGLAEPGPTSPRISRRSTPTVSVPRNSSSPRAPSWTPCARRFRMTGSSWAV